LDGFLFAVVDADAAGDAAEDAVGAVGAAGAADASVTSLVSETTTLPASSGAGAVAVATFAGGGAELLQAAAIASETREPTTIHVR